MRRALLIVLVLASAAFAEDFAAARAAFEAAWKGTDYQAKVAAIERVLDTGDIEGVKLVVERALVSDDQFVFERAVDLLREQTDDHGRSWLAGQAGLHKNKDIRVVLTKLCGSLDAPGAVAAINAGMADKEWTVRAAAVAAARVRRDRSHVQPLINLVAREDGRVREDAIDALRDLTGSDYGKNADQWEGWWRSVEKTFQLKPPVLAEPTDDAEGAPAAPEKKTDVETMSREGLYEIRSKRTLFIVDLSASMEAKTAKGSRLDVTKKELKRVIDGLGKDQLFNILFFSTGAELWKPRMVRAQGNQSAAIRRVEQSKADGMTGTFEALKMAFTLDDVDTIFFLSDGFPTAGPVTSEELIKTEVRKWNRTKGIRVHTIAFVAGELKGEKEDKDRAKAFMRELAAENGGGCTVVE